MHLRSTACWFDLSDPTARWSRRFFRRSSRSARRNPRTCRPWRYHAPSGPSRAQTIAQVPELATRQRVDECGFLRNEGFDRSFMEAPLGLTSTDLTGVDSNERGGGDHQEVLSSFKVAVAGSAASIMLWKAFAIRASSSVLGASRSDPIRSTFLNMDTPASRAASTAIGTIFD